MTKMNGNGPSARRRALAPAILLLATAAACGSSSRQSAIVGRNMLEEVYTHLANDLASAGPRDRYYQGPDAIPAAVSVCAKINPNATELIASWGGFESWRYFYVQSDCFYQVAAHGAAEEVCDRMRELVAPPPRFLLSRQRERRITQEDCRREARTHSAGGGEYGNELMLLLLGYSREEITAGGKDLLPEDGGAYEFKRSLLDGQGDDGTDYSRMEDLMRRTQRLPDFSRGDEEARRQLDALFPAWSSPENVTRVAEMLRCTTERLAAGDVMSDRCQDLVR